jgi:hypothetical protein
MTRAKFCVTAALLAFGLLTPLRVLAALSQGAAGPAPSEIPQAVRDLVQAEGVQVKNGDKIVAEYWARKEAFTGNPVSGFGIRFKTIPEGALIAVVRFAQGWSDFREQKVPAGVYTMRYVLHPEDGNHMGVAPSRDFSALTPIAAETEPAKNYEFKALVEMTKKVGNPHPSVVRLQLPEGDESPHLWKDDLEHQILDLKVVDEVVGIVVEGHSEE